MEDDKQGTYEKFHNLCTLAGEILKCRVDENKEFYKTLKELGEKNPEGFPYPENLEVYLGMLKGLEEKEESLVEDYNALFFGPITIHAMPWESVHLSSTGSLFTEETLAVRACYKKYGLALEKKNQEPDDFLGAEFGFVGHLFSLILEEKDSRKKEEIERDLKDFLKNHLLLWGYESLSRVVEKGETSFYKNFGRIGLLILEDLADFYALELRKPSE